MKVKLTGNFVETKEAFEKNYPTIHSFDDDEVEIENLRRGVLYLFTYKGKHYYGDRRYCIVEEIDE